MPKRIAWREGLFLRPQHLQQEQYLKEIDLQERTRLIRENFWGFTELNIDTSKLSDGIFLLRRASGIFPDGTLFTFEDFPTFLQIDITEKDEGKSICLSLPAKNSFEDDTYFEEDEPVPLRYRAMTEKEIPNLNLGERTFADVDFSYYNFVLSTEKPKGYTFLRIARVEEVAANGVVKLDKNIKPVFLHLDRSEELVSIVSELRSMLHYRAKIIIDKISVDRIQPAELRDYLILQILNRYDAAIDHYLSQKNVSPSDVYRAMYMFLSEIVVFMTKEKRLKAEYKYIHKNQYQVFRDIFFDIKTTLSKAIDNTAKSIVVRKYKYGVYIATLKNKELLLSGKLVLTVNASLSEDKLNLMLKNNLKIGPVEEIKNMVNHHLPGINYVVLKVPPKEIPYRVNNLYCLLRPKQEEIAKLQKSSGIALHFPDADKYDIEFGLWVIKREE